MFFVFFPSFPPQSYGVCVLGLKKLWLLIVVYGLSCSIFSSLSLCLLRLPRWLCLAAGAAVHIVLLVALLALPLYRDQPKYLGPLLVISVLWGLGTALIKTGVNSKWHLWYPTPTLFAHDVCQHDVCLLCWQLCLVCCTLRTKNVWTLSTPSSTGGRPSLSS